MTLDVQQISPTPDSQTPRTVTVAAPETVPVMYTAANYRYYKISLTPLAGLTSVTVTIYSGNGTVNVPADGLRYTINTSVEPYNDGWSTAITCDEDVAIGCMVNNLVGGVAGCTITEELA